MKKILFLLLITPMFLHAQETGVNWTRGLSWEQILHKANNENKFIFIDAYATWCGPCKRMDKNVYPNKDVIKATDENYISIKVQMDSSLDDNSQIIAWRSTARKMMEEYKVQSFPTFLFFSPQGKIMHKSVGFKNKAQFVQLLKDAQDPKKQYYVLLETYQRTKDPGAMYPLAFSAKYAGEKVIASQIAFDYLVTQKGKYNTDSNVSFIKEFYFDEKVKTYAQKIISELHDYSEDELLKKNNLELLALFPKYSNSKSKFFKLCYFNGPLVDKTLERAGYSTWYIVSTITREEVTQKLYPKPGIISKKPNWKALRNTISKKYNANYADTILPKEKLNYFGAIRDWESYAATIEYQIQRNKPSKRGSAFMQSIGGVVSDVWALNTHAWNLFENTSNKNVLLIALKWSDLSIELSDQNDSGIVQLLDTKANLLFKLGRVDEAILLEEKAIELDQKFAKTKGVEKGTFVDEFTKTLEKFKNGHPTWK